MGHTTLRFAIALLVLIFNIVLAARADAAPAITKTNPAKFRPDYSPGSFQIFGSGFLPAGEPNCSDAAVKRMRVQYRGDLAEAFRDADIIFPAGGFAGGCGDNVVVAHRFNFPTTPTVFQVRVLVDNVASTPRGIPVVVTPVTGPPTAASISPASAVEGSVEKWVKVTGTSIPGDAKVRFQGEYVQTTQSFTEYGWVQFKVPPARLAKAGRYSVQLENSKGYSNFVWFDVVAKPQVTKVEPGAIPASAFSQQSSPFPMKVYFTGSAPTTIDGKYADQFVQVPSFSVKPGYVELSLGLAGRPVAKSFTIRLANEGGQHFFVIPVASTTKSN